jgi:hypothetical protein
MDRGEMLTQQPGFLSTRPDAVDAKRSSRDERQGQRRTEDLAAAFTYGTVDVETRFHTVICHFQNARQRGGGTSSDALPLSYRLRGRVGLEPTTLRSCSLACIRR